MKQNENKQFQDVIKRAKSKGYSKKKLMDSIDQIQTDLKLRWMMTPVTFPESESLKRDLQKTYRLESYAKKHWKLKKVV